MQNKIGNGDCFEVAALVLALYDKAWAVDGNAREAIDTLKALKVGKLDLLLVHGWVTRPTDQHKHVHGWVEIPDMRLVLDYGNGLNILMPKPVYYDKGKITDTVSYSAAQTTRMLI